MDGLNIYTRWTIIFFGLLGNMIGFLVFSCKSLKTFSTRNIFRALSIVNTLFFVYLLSIDLSSQFNFKIFNSCKTLWRLNFCFQSINSWYLVLLTLEKYMSIQFMKYRFVKKNWFQFTYFVIAIILNIAYFEPSIWLLTNTEHNTLENNLNGNDQFKEINSKNILNCTLFDQSSEFSLIIKEVLIVALSPFIAILILGILLVRSIFKFRVFISKLSTPEEKEKLTNVLRFVISAVVLNVAILLFTLPIYINDVQQSYKTNQLVYEITLCFFYSSFAFHFYVLFIVNSIFRSQVFIFVKAKFRFGKK